jgi:divalent metal cation (Fe/Co/Zn/Cd) transporter
MAGTTQSQAAKSSASHDNKSSHDNKNIHHGRTLAAWVGSLVAMAAVLIGGIAVIMQNWPLFWGAVALLILGLIATKVLQVMGHGAD